VTSEIFTNDRLPNEADLISGSFNQVFPAACGHNIRAGLRETFRKRQSDTGRSPDDYCRPVVQIKLWKPHLGGSSSFVLKEFALRITDAKVIVC